MSLLFNFGITIHIYVTFTRNMGMYACSLFFHCLYKAIYKYELNQLRNFLCKYENLISLNKQNVWVADNAGGIW